MQESILSEMITAYHHHQNSAQEKGKARALSPEEIAMVGSEEN